MKMIKSLTLIVATQLILIACGGGGSNSSNDPNNSNSNGGLPPTRPNGSANGIGHDGPITGGTVSAYSWAEGKKGNFLGSAKTDQFGEYKIDFQSVNGPVLLELEGGSYIEEGSGKTISLAAQDRLQAIKLYDQGATIDLQLTHYTNWSVCLAEHMIENGKTIGDAIVQSNEVMTALAGGIGISSTRPVDITRAENITAQLTPGYRYGYLLAAYSKVTAELAEINGASPHSSSLYSTIHFSQVVCDDIRADGKMDGIGEKSESNPTGQLYIGIAPLGADVYRKALAVNILEIAGDSINAVGFEPIDLLDFANAISQNADPIYGETPASAVDLTPPTVSPLTAENNVLSGETTLNFTVEDPLGVSAVDFYVDDGFQLAGDPENPSFNFLTTSLTDGNHTITVVAKDTIGNESKTDFVYRVLNTGPAMNLTSSTLVNAAAYQITGTINSSVPIASVTASLGNNTVAATLDNGTWSAPLTLPTGTNSILVTATDNVGNKNTATYSVNYDGNSPLIKHEPTRVTFSDGSGQLNLCVFGELASSNNSVPLCLSSSSTSLNGKPISLALPNDDFIIVRFDVNDVSSNGVFTEPEELTVEYRYLVENEQVVNWSPAPRQEDLLANVVLVPITTEYLGNNFFNVSNETEHEIQLRVTDKAGNVTETSIDFRLDVIIPSLIVTSELSDKVFKTNFNDRLSVSGRVATFRHVIDNSRGVGFVMKVQPREQHSMTQRYSGILRENIGRMRTQYQWQGHTGNNDWQNIDYLLYGLALNEIRPRSILGELVSVKVDEPSSTTSNWVAINRPNDVICTPGGRNGNRIGDFWMNGSINPACRVRPDNSYQVFLRERSEAAYEPEEGYPRDRVKEYSKVAQFDTQGVSVLNVGENREIVETEGWYRVPSGATVYMDIAYSLPEFTPYTDVRVSNGGGASYESEAFLDDELQWNIDSRVIVERGIDPGNSDFYDTLTTRQETLGRENTLFTIRR